MAQQKPKFESDEDLAQIMRGHGPCTYLLLALIALILVSPHLESGTLARISRGILYSAVLLGGASVISRDKRTTIARFGLAIVAVALQWAAVLTKDMTLLQLTCIVYAVFLLITIAEVLRYILKRGPVTADKLHGALAGYIMIALLWVFIYALVESFTPGSFAPSQLRLMEPDTFFMLLYFSFTTLTTTGFGDITPVTDQARSWVMIEQLAGVFFVAVLIARLAGLYPPAVKG